jgi:surfactin synthase thioesterase subunit
MKKLRLYCVPYAGGSAGIFNKWKGFLDEGIELYPVELAGRGRRSREPLYTTMEEAVDDVYNQLQSELDQHDYALFGHSMGSLIIFELYHKLMEKKHKKPFHVFFSGSRAPHLRNIDEDMHLLPDDEFLERIKNFGGTPEEFFTNNELLNIFLPILRADIKVVATYKCGKRTDRLDCPITVFGGTEDEINFESLVSWNEHTTKAGKVHLFPGGHFFINSNTQEVVQGINQTLMQYHQTCSNNGMAKDMFGHAG